MLNLYLVYCLLHCLRQLNFSTILKLSALNLLKHLQGCKSHHPRFVACYRQELNCPNRICICGQGKIWSCPLRLLLFFYQALLGNIKRLFACLLSFAKALYHRFPHQCSKTCDCSTIHFKNPSFGFQSLWYQPMHAYFINETLLILIGYLFHFEFSHHYESISLLYCSSVPYSRSFQRPSFRCLILR